MNHHTPVLVAPPAAPTFDAVLELRDRIISYNAEHEDTSALLDLALLELELHRHGTASADPVGALGRAMTSLRKETKFSPWLYAGAAGVGWLAARISASLNIEISGMGAIDQAVLGVLRDVPPSIDIDLPQGPLGLAVYGIAHPDRDVAQSMINMVLELIANRSERDDDGIFWRLTDRPFRRETRPDTIGQRDLGVAHGQAGVVAVLSSIVSSQLGDTRLATALLEQATHWLLAQRCHRENTHFSHVAESAGEESRDAWCYGDPGIALALFQAGDVLGNEDVLAIATQVSSSVVERSADTSQVIDPSICHGSSFLAFLGRRLEARTDNPQALIFANHWETKTIEKVSEGTLLYPVHGSGLEARPHFLEGDAGVALALLTHTMPTRPVWTDLLLADRVLTAAELTACSTTLMETN